MTTEYIVEQGDLHLVRQELNKLLLDEISLDFTTRNFNFNPNGSKLYDRNLFYESRCGKLDSIMNDIAETFYIINKHTQLKLADYSKAVELQKQPASFEQTNLMKNLVLSHEVIISSLKKLVVLFTDTYEDISSKNFITDLLLKHKKMVALINKEII